MQVAALGEPLRIHVTLDPKGYRKVLFTIALIRMRFLLPLAAFFGCAALGGGRTSSGIMIVSATVGLLLFMWGYIEWQVHSPAVSQVYLPVDYEVRDDGLHYESASGSGVVTWDTFTRWRMVADHFVLHLKGARFLAIPLASMDVPTATALERVLRTHIRKGPRSGLRREGPPPERS